MNSIETITVDRGDQRNSGWAWRLPRRGALAALLLGGMGLTLMGTGAAPAAHAAGSLPGTVVAWGCGSGTNVGQCSVPAGLSGVSAIAAGYYDSLALKSDGSVVAWGCGSMNSPGGTENTDYGQCGVPAPPSRLTYTAIAAGAYHSLALRSDGSVVAWGCNSSLGGSVNYGQCSVPGGTTYAAVAAGQYHSLALKSNGSVVAWGCKGVDYGQCSVPSGLSGVSAVAAGAYHSLALISPASVKPVNLMGQLAGYWPLNEGSGTTTADATGAGNNGALQGGTTWTSGKFGNAVHFDGSSAYIAAGAKGLPAANAPQSISFWLNVPTVPSTVQDMVDLTNDTAGSSVQIGFRGGQLVVWGYTVWYLATAPAPSANSWHHIVYTFDGTTHRLYVDGVLQGSSTVAQRSGTPTALTIGSWEHSEYLAGSVDDVRIYARALSQSEVQALDTQP